MTDPFNNSGGSIPGTDAQAIIRRVSMRQMAAEKAVSAYKNNIAPPDLHIADHTRDYTPKVVGEDGQELTIERRRELMAGKDTMIDENGCLREDADYTNSFDDDIEQERLGKSAEDCREGYRVIKPRELSDTPVDVDINFDINPVILETYDER